MGKKRKAERRAQRERIEHALVSSPPVAAATMPMRPVISDSALMAASVKDERLIGTPFEVARPAPGVVPEGAPVIANDDALNGMYAYAQAAAFSDGMQWLGYPYLAELAQRPEYRRISETIAKEMTRKWIKIQAQGDEKSDKVKGIETAFKRYHVQRLFRRATETDGFFGRAQIYIDTGHSDNPEELETPLTRRSSKIGRGSLKRLGLIEPIWSYPTDYNATDPLHKDYYKPRAWYVQGKKVHASRMLTFVAREVPDLLKPAYAFGGLSLSQIARPYIENWLRTRQSVSDLIHSFSVSGIKTNMLSTLNDLSGGGDALQRRVRLFNAHRDNRGMMLIDKETEEFFNVSTPLGTLDHLQAQSQEQMASVSGIPLVVLLGITPSGLNASTDGEIKAFYAWIEAQQEQFFADNLTKILEIIQLSAYGYIDPDITFRFEPLWALDDAAKATVRKTDADTDMEYVNGGVLSPLEVRQRLADAEDSLYQGLDVEDVPAPPPDPMGGDPNDPMGGDPTDPSTPPDPTAPANQNHPPVKGPPQAPVKGPPAQAPVKAPPQPKQAQDKEFDEGKIHRGQPENAGQFGPGGGGSKPAAKPAAVKSKAPTGSPQYNPLTTVHALGQTKSLTNPNAVKPTRWTGLTPAIMQGKARTQENGAPLPAHVLAAKIPPGYTRVAYNPDPNAALIAMARDSEDRDVPYYQAALAKENADAKFNRVAKLSDIIDRVQQSNDRAKADPRTAAVADCFDLVMKMGIRPGSKKDTKAKAQAYGATTLQGRHVVDDEGGVWLRFVGKEGQHLNLPVMDDALAKTLLERARQAGPDRPLFNGVAEDKLLAHTKAMTGSAEYLTKDFRTLLGTTTAAALVKAVPRPADAKAYQKAVMDIATQVSAKLGNKPQMALKAYISPVVWSQWQVAA